MKTDLCADLLHHIDDGSLECDSAPAAYITWLKKKKIPNDLLFLLQSDWPQNDGPLGKLSIHSSTTIKDNEYTETLTKYKLFPIGSARNGDFLVLDYGSPACIPGFISHEEWDGETEPRLLFQPIASSFESLLYRISESRYVPLDYYIAKQFNEMSKEKGA